MPKLIESSALPADSIPTAEETNITDDTVITDLKKLYAEAQNGATTDREKTKEFTLGICAYAKHHLKKLPKNGKPEFHEPLQGQIDAIKKDKKKNNYNPFLLVLWTVIGVPEDPTDTDKARNTKIANAMKLALTKNWGPIQLKRKYDKIGGLSGMSKECQASYSLSSVPKCSKTLASYNPPVRRSNSLSQKPVSALAPEAVEWPPINPMYGNDAEAVVPLEPSKYPELAGRWKIEGIIIDGVIYVQHKAPYLFYAQGNDSGAEASYLPSEAKAEEGAIA